MKKQCKNILGEKNYLLGISKEDKKKVWLAKASWDCGWYWGFGYVETYNKWETDIYEHNHFDSLFLKEDIFHSFVDYFEETTLSEGEIWELLELMKTFYTLRDYAEFCHNGSAWISSNKFKDILQDKNQEKHINETLIPKICDRIYEILSNEEN